MIPEHIQSDELDGSGIVILFERVVKDMVSLLTDGWT